MRRWFRRKKIKNIEKATLREASEVAGQSTEALENQEAIELPEITAPETATPEEAASQLLSMATADGAISPEETGAATDMAPEPSEGLWNKGLPAEDNGTEFADELPPDLPAQKKGLFRRFRERLGRTREALTEGLDRLFVRRRVIDEELLGELEEVLITADLGVDTTLRLIEALRLKVKRRELNEVDRLKAVLKKEMVKGLAGPPPQEMTARPWVVLLVGVNGVGKTTTIAKLAHRDRLAGRQPLLVAADTFRAAAVEQLEIWGQRVGAEVIKQKSGAAPAAVVFDGLTAALARQADIVYIDTAGRLHTRVNLMAELQKICRTAGKKLAGAPHEVLLVLDATTGQNALSQARLFQEAVGVSGLILTKLDGTAKGGVALAVNQEIGLPIRYVGIGEKLDDLKPFDPEAFVAAILG